MVTGGPPLPQPAEGRTVTVDEDLLSGAIVPRMMPWFRRLLVALALASFAACAPPSGGPEPTDAGPPPVRPDEEDAGPAGPVHLTITFDYRFDDEGFFTPSRRAVLEEAAAVWGRLLTDDFEAVPAGTPLLTRDPEDPSADSVEVESESDVDDLIVFVGGSSLDGSGGLTARSFPSATLDVGDAALAASLATRYDGADFEPWSGWITFDVAEDWFTDESPRTSGDVPFDRADLLSTATHELGHVLGFGSAPAFRALTDQSGFVGAQASEVYGGPVPLTSDGAHLPDGVLVDGERPLMDVTDPEGVRFSPTALDLAFLADVGYELFP